MSKHKTILFGTSRLHRPFAKRSDGKLIVSEHENIEIIYPKIGYFHTAAEILQVIKFLMYPESIPFNIRKYVFWIEPRATTPLNEFDPQLEICIKNGTIYQPKIFLEKIHSVVLEISSLSVKKHTPSGCFLHANPNFLRNIPYNEIYPDGYYKKYEPDLSVENIETSVENLVNQINDLKKALPGKAIIICAHLRSENYPNQHRNRIHLIAKEACMLAKVIYIDIAPVLDAFGFACSNGTRDIHHLSIEGENALSQIIFNIIESHT